MIDFLKLSKDLGDFHKFVLEPNQSNKDFVSNALSAFDSNGIVAMIIPFTNANGHIAPWDNDEKIFLDDENYLNGNYQANEVYFWKID